MLGSVPAACAGAGGGPARGRDPASGKGWRGPERICPGLGAGGAGRAGMGIPRGGARGCPEALPEASGGRSGWADRGAGTASPGASRVGGGASAGTSCLGAEGARDNCGEGPAWTECSAAASGSDDARPGAPFDSPVSLRFTSIATGSSIELEWVFFSATPNSGSMSRITFGLTSSSRASSLMRILLILWRPGASCSSARDSISSPRPEKLTCSPDDP
jgi:hypothetical protein